MYLILGIFGVFMLTSSSSLIEQSAPLRADGRCQENLSVSKMRLASTLNALGKTYRIFYSRNSREITLRFGRSKAVLQKIPKNYDPSLVGAEAFIGFLPDSLQAYKEEKILAYISTIRTNGGSVGGQCEAGAEIYLNFVGIKGELPKKISRILIGSCTESTELFDQDVSSGVLQGISVDDKHICLHFLSFKNFDGSPTAVVGPDFKGPVFE